MCVKPESSRAMRERLEGSEGRQDSVNVGKLSLSTINTSQHEDPSSFSLHFYGRKMAGDPSS